jgi:hypothetical protein
MADLTVPCAATVAGAQVPGHVTLTSDRLRWRPDAASATGEKSAALVSITAHQVRSIHWSPYDRVRVVNADP